MEFKYTMKKEYIYKYLIFIIPQCYVLFGIIYGIAFIAILIFINDSAVIWKLMVCFILVCCWKSTKYGACRNLTERIKDLYQMDEMNGKILFKDENLLAIAENGEEKEYSYRLFGKLYSLKKVYILKTKQGNLFIIDKKNLTCSENKEFMRLLKMKMSQIKVIGGRIKNDF